MRTEAMRRGRVVVLFVAIGVLGSHAFAQSFATVHFFDEAAGRHPVGGLVRGGDGRVYGTTSEGSIGGDLYGTVFALGVDDGLATLHSFDWTDGARPDSALIEASDGFFYGTTVVEAKETNNLKKVKKTVP